MRKIIVAALAALLCGLVVAGAARPRGGSAEAGTAAVTIKDFEFQPRQITVKAGTTVTWTNDGASSHTVNADDGSFSSPTLGKGQTFSRKFAKPGTYPYYCAFHGGKGGDGMTGTVVVTR
jgi:plastocyanin